MSSAQDSGPIWTPAPSRAAATRLAAFMRQAFMRKAKIPGGASPQSYADLHRWSVTQTGDFWEAIWDECGVIGERAGPAVRNADVMLDAAFFPDARINYAENLLRANDDRDAIVFWGEDKVRTRWSGAQLHARVSQLQQALRAAGIGRDDRVAAMLPNLPDTVALMLAVASLGAVWSSCSPDFGTAGVLDRFGQIEPKVFIGCDFYWYNGKHVAVAEKSAEVARKLPSAKLFLLVSYPRDDKGAAVTAPGATGLADFVAPFVPKPVTFERLPFNHPLFILFSSGTTGVPKCIMHGAGGTLLQHLKEHQLHCDIRAGDRVFYFTTCGWMMWNWLVSSLASGAALMLYDGAPQAGGGALLFDYAQAERFTLFGTSAKFIDTCAKAGLEPIKTHDLASLRTVTSTGSPLSEASFDYVYRAIARDVHLASISGGTDIVSCFVLGNPMAPVWRGELQVPGLGMAVDVWSEDGAPLRAGKGELVCTRPFPSMPIGFWNDPGRAKYTAAYFERFPGVWAHGDFAEWTAHDGLIIHGRSDATLNPGGVRIGTAEIYAQVEQIPQVLESVAVAQDWQDDVRIVLFVRLREGITLDEALRQTIAARIRTGASPRHVPAKTIQIADIPRTKSGKITELAIREVIHGRPVKNKEALANPEALAFYENLDALRA